MTGRMRGPGPDGRGGREPRRRAGLEWTALCAILGGLLVALGSCANPVPPSGGPRDETPPSIVETRPARDTVNVSTDTRSVYIGFSEYIERSTLTRALSITPRFDGRLRFDWSGRGVAIELPSALRDSTTYIFSFSTDLTDAHGVSLETPLTVAFATGPRINQGQIRGRVVAPRQARPLAQVDVFAYAGDGDGPPTPLPDRPAYRTQTGEEGGFTFNYLREQRYFVVAVRDNNRNRRPDAGEPFAVPPRPALPADADSTEVPVPWLLTRADTTGPQFQQVTPLSRQRVRLSFDEPVRPGPGEAAAWPLRDSVADAPVAVRAVYRPPGRADALVLRTAPMDSTRHTLPLTPDLVVDTLGQGVRPDTARFRAAARPDTTRTRFQTYVPEGLSPDSVGNHPLLPGVQPGVRFSQVPDSSVLRAVLSARDTAGAARSYRLVPDERRAYRLRLRPPLGPDEIAEVAVDLRPIAGPDTTYRRRFRRVTSEILGGLEGRAVLADATYETAPMPASPRAAADSVAAGVPDTTARPPPDSARADGPVVVEMIATESTIPVEPRQQAVPPGSTFVFENLPEGSFRFRAFHDRNENGRWDGGLLRPFVPAEPLTWSENPTDSRPRWTNVLPAPLRIPTLRLVEAEAPAPAPDSTAPDSLRPSGRRR
ncbi:MAG: Ig-like domain-containing protein [Salinibacter sp.]